jgi:hypothetical protein
MDKVNRLLLMDVILPIKAIALQGPKALVGFLRYLEFQVIQV